MQTQDKAQQKCVNILLRNSVKAYTKVPLSVVANSSRETACGWRLARPCAEYDLQNGSTKKQLVTVGTRTSLCKRHLAKANSGTSPVASLGGKLTESFDYVYSGGLSTKVRQCESREDPYQATTRPQLPSFANNFTPTLSPVVLCRSQLMSESVRRDLERLVQMQLKPDIAYEQMIIEQKLRNMDMNRIPAISTTGLSKQKADKSKRPRLKVQPITLSSVPETATKSMQLQVHSSSIQLQVQNSGTWVQAQNLGITNKMGIQPVKWCMLHSRVPDFSRSSRNRQTTDNKEKTRVSGLLQSSSFLFSYHKS